MKPLNKYIDHTNFKPFAMQADIEKLCDEAYAYDFASVCVNPCHVAHAKGLLEGCDVKVCTGFSAGAVTVEDVRLMKANLSGNTRIKASAGIKTYGQTVALIEAGAAIMADANK